MKNQNPSEILNQTIFSTEDRFFFYFKWQALFLFELQKYLQVEFILNFWL